MGWSSGSYVMDDIIKSLSKHINDETLRQKIYFDLIVALEDADWDNAEECCGTDVAYDKAYRELNPDMDD